MLDQTGVALEEKLLQPVPGWPGRGLRVVALGGGTGLPVLLRGLKVALFPPGAAWVPERDAGHLTAIVTVADDGGSSGRLRRAYRVLAPGDIRNCLLALSEAGPALEAVFRHRFEGNGEVAGHNLGNLILTALSQVENSFLRAIDLAGEILAIRGRVLPSTRDQVTLIAEFVDGSRVAGESQIASLRRPIARVSLAPERARALPQALEALQAADLIVIAPGSLYTSILPVLLIKEIADAIAVSPARVALVLNLMTEPGETDGYNGTDLLLALRRHAPQVPVHDVLVNSAPTLHEVNRRYATTGALPIPVQLESLRALGCRPVLRDLLGPGPQVRHDPHKLAGAILELAGEMPERVLHAWSRAS